MSENGRPSPPWFDGALFNINMAKHPLELFLQHACQHVAWSLDGTQLIESAATDEELWKKLDAAGIPSDQVVHDYIDDPNLSVL